MGLNMKTAERVLKGGAGLTLLGVVSVLPILGAQYTPMVLLIAGAVVLYELFHAGVPKIEITNGIKAVAGISLLGFGSLLSFIPSSITAIVLMVAGALLLYEAVKGK